MCSYVTQCFLPQQQNVLYAGQHPCSIPFQLLAPMLGSLSKHHISCQQHCSNASVRFLPSQQNSLITDHAASWSSSHISCTVVLRQLFRAWEKSETTALLQRQILRVLFVTERLSSGRSLAGRELFFTFVASYAKQTKSSLVVQCLRIPNHPFSHKTIFADTSLECGDALCMARSTGVLTGGGERKKKSAYTCHGLLRTWSQMLPSSPVGNYSSLKGCWGTLGVAGRGGLCVRVSKRDVGVAPDVCSKRSRHSTTHLHITTPQTDS